MLHTLDMYVAQFFRTLFMEERSACGPSVDIWPPRAPPPLLVLQHILDSCADEPAVALHHGRTYAPRLVMAPKPTPRSSPAADSRKTAVITGGTKGLGLQLAKDLAAAGQGTLLLASRHPRLTRADLEQLAANGTAVFVVKCNTADPKAAARLADWVREILPVVQTWAHAAGALGHDLIPDVTPDAFLKVVRPKVSRWAMLCASEMT